MLKTLIENTLVMTIQGDILTVLIILSATVLLLVFEIIRIDVVAIVCMLALGWTRILDTREMLSGFSSNAVVVMMAVMIMGRGIAKTGIMDRFSQLVLKKAGEDQRKLTALLSVSVGTLSGLIQNIGAVALFLPGILSISRRGRFTASELIMPIGFAAILGGTLTMVGSGPLILINDLLRTAGLEPYGIFSVTPVGILLVTAGTLYFMLAGKYVLPKHQPNPAVETDQERLIRTLHLAQNIWHYTVPETSPLVGKTTEASGIWKSPGVNLLGLSSGDEISYAPWRETIFEAGQELVLLGEEAAVSQFAFDNGLMLKLSSFSMQQLHDPQLSGFAEVIIPYNSDIIGKTIRQYAFRKRFGVEPVIMFNKGQEIQGDFSDFELTAGDTIIVYGLWERISDLRGLNFVVVTPFTLESKDSSKTFRAVLCFVAAIGLALAGFSVPLAFFSGAAAMVLTRVLTIDEAYTAIEWKVVFLLAGLIPLGTAMQKTGAAVFLAEQTMTLIEGLPVFFTILAVGVLATVFSLLMSNVGAIVVLAPLVISVAGIAGIDPRPLALMAAVCAANSFILPTHQVNAYLMSSGGYKNRDYFKAGSGMTLIFLAIVVTYFTLVMY